LKIAVDASARSGQGGIARYLRALLPRAIALGGHEWLLYARQPLPGLAGATVRADGWPPDAGRIASLLGSQPHWARRDRPDLFWGPAHRLPVGLPAGTARVVTIHDLCWLEAPATMRRATRWLDRLLMPRALRQADRVIAVSHATRDTLVRAFPSVAGRIVVVSEACEALPPAGAPRVEGRYVLAVGTVEPRKNLTRLIEAFARVPTTARLVLAGGRGWGMEQPEAIAARAGIAARFTYLGAVADDELAALYRDASLLAMPSLYEGFGLPLLEALSCGTPVLYGDNSSMPEVAGDAGLAVDASSVESIAEGIARLLHDDALRHRLAARATAQAAKFSWDRAARETLAVFDQAIAERRARRGGSAA
jgi:glycosyltransferase involved in cell wall biosynthesis